ncbi:MAG: FKBP-type peptidyl-prolyl cis-trans isomerase [Planctomycetes bacterium]|nr:FKBP-type peptidyl-prolyl cis-trans isomerase [Planctomycetota bacterium]
MRPLCVLALAALAFAPFAPGEEKKEPRRPALGAKEWKKQKSGLEIWDVKEGKGEEVKPGASVVVHYTGWLTDDQETKFDSSLDRGKKAKFPLDMVIKGWQEGVAGMKPGGVRRLKIPSDLGYGADGQGKIPGNATLVFEIELFEAKNPLERPALGAKEWKKQKSGLEIWDVKEGKGEAVKEGDTITVHYTGWLTDDKATTFDSSLDRGEPVSFPLNGLIKGWQEGIPGMKPGGVRRLKIPSDLGYGDREKEGIPANSVLVFEIELIEAK